MDINLPMDPPVNNNLEGNIYDKLDAMSFERTRVANSQLNTRLCIQERILAKYRQDAERIHETQSKRLRREYLKIQDKKPDYVYDDSAVYDNKRRSKDCGRTRSLSECSNNSGYCKRFYSHHYHIKDASKKVNDDADKKKASNNDYFNFKFRLYFLNMLNQTPCSDNDSLPQNSQTNDTGDLVGSRDVLNDVSDIHDIGSDIGHLDDADRDVFETSLLNSSLDSSVILPKHFKRSQSLAHPEIASEDTVERKRRQRKLKARQSLQDLSTRGRGPVGISSEDFEKRKELWKRPRKTLEKLQPTK